MNISTEFGNYPLKYKGTLQESANNLITSEKSGIYDVYSPSYDCPGPYGTLVAIAHTYYKAQIFIQYTSLAWVRGKPEGAWNSWWSINS